MMTDETNQNGLQPVTSKELLERFSTNTRYLCKQKEIKIGELEEKLGVSKGYLSRVTTSKKAIKLSSIYMTAKILEVSIDDLFNEDLMITNRIRELEEELNKLKTQQRGDR